MSNIKSILFLFVVIFVASCDDLNSDLKDSKIIGRWNVTDFNASGTWEAVDEGTIYVQFNSDHTFKSRFEDVNTSGTWVIEGTNTIKCNVSGDYVTYTVLDIDKDQGTFEVKEPGFLPYSIKAVKE